MALFVRPVTMRMSLSPDLAASSTTYWIAGLSTIGSISLGWDFVYGRNRVPSPAAGMTAFMDAGRTLSLFITLCAKLWLQVMTRLSEGLRTLRRGGLGLLLNWWPLSYFADVDYPVESFSTLGGFLHLNSLLLKGS